jgi:hypothetical protein
MRRRAILPPDPNDNLKRRHMSRRRFQEKKTGKLRPYAPLISFGTLALASFIVLLLVESAMCKMMAISVKNGPCTVRLPEAFDYIPLFFLLLGVIGTAWNLVRSKSFPEF